VCPGHVGLWRITLSLSRAVILSAANPPDPRLDLAGRWKKLLPHRYHSPQTGRRGEEGWNRGATGDRYHRVDRTNGRRLSRSKMRAYICRLKHGRANIIIRTLSDSKRGNSGTDLGNCCGNGWKFVRGTSLQLAVLNEGTRARALMREFLYTCRWNGRSWDFIM